MPEIVDTQVDFEREPLAHPFGFKGGAMTEIWQVVAGLDGASGHRATGLAVQSVLWSDAGLFAERAEGAGNCLMFLMTEFALREARGRKFETPPELLRELFPRVLEFGKQLTGRADLRPTFALNALVAVDLAAWQLCAREREIADFDSLMRPLFGDVLGGRQERLGRIPLISYGTTVEEVRRLVRDGCFFLKIKIGADPDGDGDRQKMLDWDRERLTALHRELGALTCPYTENGKVAYYLDANGRYDSRERLLALIEHADRIGAGEHIHLLEEPFPEESEEDVSDLPIRIAADESAHTAEDAIRRMELGYGAVALKPIAKTLSMSLEVAREARERGVPCFCADLTVNPLMVEWNRNVAARIEPLPGLKVGVFETNGEQIYSNWDKMRSYHPLGERSWVCGKGGFFPLDEEYYRTGGGIFEPSPHYEARLAAYRKPDGR